jgi:hypothetical protein
MSVGWDTAPIEDASDPGSPLTPPRVQEAARRITAILDKP